MTDSLVYRLSVLYCDYTAVNCPTLGLSGWMSRKKGWLVVKRILWLIVWESSQDSMVLPYGNSCEKSLNMPTTWPLLALSSMHTHLMEASCLHIMLNWHIQVHQMLMYQKALLCCPSFFWDLILDCTLYSITVTVKTKSTYSYMGCNILFCTFIFSVNGFIVF